MGPQVQFQSHHLRVFARPLHLATWPPPLPPTSSHRSSSPSSPPWTRPPAWTRTSAAEQTASDLSLNCGHLTAKRARSLNTTLLVTSHLLAEVALSWTTRSCGRSARASCP